MTERCTLPASPTCVLPALGERVSDVHTCRHCGRVWRAVVNVRKQRYWCWDGTEGVR